MVVARTADAIAASLESIDIRSFEDPAHRVKLKNAALALASRLQTPWETTYDCVGSRPALNAALKTCIDAGLFRKWVQTNKGPRTATELARMTNTDPVLLRRLLRHIAAMHALKEISEDVYEMTHFTETLAGPGNSNCFAYWVDINGPGFGSLPAFLADTKYADPQDLTHSNWQKHTNSDLNFFEWLAANPKPSEEFNYTMMAYAASKPTFGELYASDNLINGWDKQAPLLVDMGGSSGHDIEQFRAQNKGLPKGSLVLQDLAGPIGEAQIQPPVEAQVHDFLEPQPVKGARAYYMHTVLHDWPDDKATLILKNIAAAMTPGYSKVLLHETVIAASNAHSQTTTSDLTMMMAFSAVERTEQAWNDLLATAGLKTVKIWGSPAAMESVIEAELA